MTAYIAEVLSEFQYLCLLSNCTKRSANRAQIEYKYLAILYGYLESWSLNSVLLKDLFNQMAARATLVYPL